MNGRLVIVSEDQGQIQKAQTYAASQGLKLEVMSESQWEKLTHKPLPGSSTDQNNVLPFPGVNHGTHGINHGVNLGGVAVGQSVATINQLENVAIENAIAAFNGNLTEAARALGIGRATLYRKVKLYNLDLSIARKKRKMAA